MPEMPRIDMDKCDRCGLCVSVCTCGAIVLTNNTIRFVETDQCGWCTMCEAVCPLGVICCAFEIVFDD